MATVERDIKYSVPVPTELDELVRERMKRGGFNSMAEYVRSVIRADLELTAQRELERKLLQALERGDYKELTSDFWAKLRERASKEESAT